MVVKKKLCCLGHECFSQFCIRFTNIAVFSGCCYITILHKPDKAAILEVGMVLRRGIATVDWNKCKGAVRTGKYRQVSNLGLHRCLLVSTKFLINSSTESDTSEIIMLAAKFSVWHFDHQLKLCKLNCSIMIVYNSY